ncbi:hypothetical protein PV728_24890 [Streptomyces europaeiscabiei]|uniref:hypothetical protein n=2 Tax=Streptomyces TaxID=1883 RepID=UPI0029BBABD0|nr:hypothetical protein [Streptomyces europaeiscabiei]MDX3633446.1 hypothetical protein [Streptomyces europaeiscabiei]MDX3650648.1 hypothetical protein [Streptomyces europaeiscabiei]
MAMGFFQHLADDNAVAWPGGSEPGFEVAPSVIVAMSERGIDISRDFAKPWTDEVVRAAGVVSVGCGKACPVFPGKRYLDWTLGDPEGKTVDDVRLIRDDIERQSAASATTSESSPTLTTRQGGKPSLCSELECHGRRPSRGGLMRWRLRVLEGRDAKTLVHLILAHNWWPSAIFAAWKSLCSRL